MHILKAGAFDADLAWFDEAFGPSLPVPIFDFDGVLSSPVEDLVYKLPERPGEHGTLERAAVRHGIAAQLYDTRYLRHLVLQAALQDRGVPPEPGPLLGLARQLGGAGRPFFVLTARSGGAAVKRLLSFLDHHGLAPQEVFCVGRVAKGRQLAVVRSTVPLDTAVVYFEDTVRHVRNSQQQEFSGFSTVHVAWNPPPWLEAEAMIEDFVLDSVRVLPVRSAA